MGGPRTSPHGNHRAVVPVSNIIESSQDYLLPLTRSIDGDGRLRQSDGYPDNWYINFLYVKAGSVDRIKSKFGMDQAWLDLWQIAGHEYFRFANGNLRYAHRVNGRKTWCKILVPYQVLFTPEVRWEYPEDLHTWRFGHHEVTEAMTTRVAIELGWFSTVPCLVNSLICSGAVLSIQQ